MPELVTIKTRSGVPFTVAREAAPRFQGLLDDLEKNGYPLKSNESGGYNDRNIAGTSTKSQHAFGNAVDVNWNDNPRGGSQPSMPPFLADSLARKHGMTWGGTWNNPDPMHFEVARDGSTPLNARSITAVAGHEPGGAYASVHTAQAAPAATRGAFVAPQAQGLSPAPGKNLGGAVGGALGAFAQGGGDNSERLASMAKSGREASASMLSEDDQRQMAALKAVLARKTALGTA
jgi:hypothetical protein